MRGDLPGWIGAVHPRFRTPHGSILLMAGLPLSFVTGGLGCVFLFLFGSLDTLNILPSRIFPYMTNYQLSAVPLFIFMGVMLERSRLAVQPGRA